MSGVASGLPPCPLLVALPAAVSAVGLAVDDYEAVLRAAAGLNIVGVPEPAVLKRRAEFLAGRLAAMHALSALGVSQQPGRLPDGSPSWPGSTVGSISHGAGRALCAVARRADFRSLGIDAERLLEADARDELRSRICAESERLLLATALGLPDHHHVSVVFSAKESLFKCLYPLVGKYMDFGAARVVAATRDTSSASPGALSGQLTLELHVDWSELFLAGRVFQASFVVAADHVETAVALAA